MSFDTEVYILQLESYDLILGVQWLSTLGDIRWNFSSLSMVFMVDGVEYRLHGEEGMERGNQLHYMHFRDNVGLQSNDQKLSQIMAIIEGLPWACYILTQEEL